MWSIESKRTGKSAYPARSRLVGKDIDPSRFAYWVIKNNKHGITIPLYIYLPLNPKTCKKVIFSIHGRERNANKYRNVLVEHIQAENVFLVAPEFRDGIFSSSLALTIGNMREKLRSDQELQPDLWTFNIIDSIFKLIASESESIECYSVFGHSAGAQFAYRLALLTNHAALDSVVAANPGWLTIVDPEVDFPYGIRGRFNREEIKHILSKKLVMLAGEKDTEVDDHVRLSKSAMVQGGNRFERANYAFNQAKSIAKKMRAPFHWKLVIVRDLKHSAWGAAPVALPYLL